MTRQELKQELFTLSRTLDKMAVCRPGGHPDFRSEAFMRMVDREGELLHMLYEVSPIS